MQRSVRNQNELLIESVGCEFERYVTQSPLPTYSVYFVLDDGLQSGRIQISKFIRHIFSKYGEDVFSKLFFTALNKPHASSTAESHFFFFFAGAVSINQHPLSWSS
jgi:hypothetical protein